MSDVLQFQVARWQWVTGGCVPRTDQTLVLMMPKGNSITGTYAGGGVWRNAKGKVVETPLAWRYRK
jgi:hypothetical protein